MYFVWKCIIILYKFLIVFPALIDVLTIIISCYLFIIIISNISFCSNYMTYVLCTYIMANFTIIFIICGCAFTNGFPKQYCVYYERYFLLYRNVSMLWAAFLVYQNLNWKIYSVLWILWLLWRHYIISLTFISFSLTVIVFNSLCETVFVCHVLHLKNVSKAKV